MIKLTKISESYTPDFKSAEWQNFIPGEDNPGVSIPIDYWIKGTLVKEPKIGESLFVSRTERNGVASIGLFSSSLIVEISKHAEGVRMLETRNSIYLLEELVD